MKGYPKMSWSLTALTLLFAGLAAAFVSDLWGRPAKLTPRAAVDPSFTNTATVRLSAAQVISSGGDASGFDCYACHDKAKPVVIQYDTNHNLVLPKEHGDLVMAHGRNNRNESCFNCHDPENLDMLKTRSGKLLKLTESTLLCASCHGPTYRDWEIGIHGRVSGYWNAKLGASARQDCASCHNPHSPAFPQIQPAPRPHQLHEGVGKTTEHHENVQP
jgi:formate-dependent nitrite reductase cytochrome c552 subunit